MVTRTGDDGREVGTADDTRGRPLLAEETWSRVGEIIETALSIPDAAARAAFVDTSCASDRALLAEVRSLLAADTHADFVLPATRWLDATTLARDAAATMSDPPEHWIGRRVGAWRIEQWLASGGMGLIFRARRDDAAYEQTVAIKLLRARGTASTQWFLDERQMLASLAHPCIARLLDGGAAEDGTLYLVMELVEGEAIDRWCVRKRPAPDEWLARFLDVCAAVQYAHQRLIVHRDIKPANVMVTHDGSVKLIDFGIAQITDRAGGPASADSAAVALTPGWASPEQLRGEPVTTASDIHALGALLQRLANGGEPLANGTDVADDDLRCMVRKAMAEVPSQRYASAAQLADDVRRYLAHEPVQARGGGVGYRATRFVQRHTGGVALATLALVGVLVAASIALYQAQVARAAEREASVQRARAEQHFASVRKMTNQLLFDLHRKLAGIPGTTQLQKDLIGQSLAYLDGLRTDAGGDAGLLHEVGAGYRRLGRILGGIQGANTGERDASEQAYEKAVAALDAALAIRPQTTTAVEQLKTLTEFAEQQGLYRNFPKSSALFARAAALGSEATTRAADDADLFYAVQKVIVARNISALYLGNGSFDQSAMEQSAQALVARQAAHAPASDDTQTIRAILWRCYTALAEASRRSGGADGARQAVNWHQRGVALMRANEQLHPGDAGYRRSTLNARVELANAYAAADDLKAAIAEADAVLGEFEALRQADAANEDAVLDLLKTIASLADYHRRAGDVAQTSAMVERGQRVHTALAARLRDHFVARQSQLKLLLAQAWVEARAAAPMTAGARSPAQTCARAAQHLATARQLAASDPALTATDVFAGVDAAVNACEQSASAGRRRG